MRKYIIFFFSVLLFLSACSSGTPDGIIDKNTMVTLLTDVHITDGTMLSMSQTPDTLYKYGRGRYDAVFAKYHTDSAQFRKSFLYYASKQPVVFSDMYDQVLKNLQVKTDSITKVLTKQNAGGSRKPYLPGAPGAGGMPGAQVPHGPFPQENPVAARQRFEKMQAKRDSLIKTRKLIK